MVFLKNKYSQLMKNEEEKHGRVEKTAVKSRENLLDVSELVRSLQRREGNVDCFRQAEGFCDREDCCWRRWCLERPEDAWKKE